MYTCTYTYMSHIYVYILFRIAILENFKSYKNVMESFFNVKNFMSSKKVMQRFFIIKIFKSLKKVMESFSVLKNFKSCKAVVEFFLSFKSFKPLCSCSEHFWNSRWKSPHVSNDCLCKLLLTGLFLYTHSVN